MTAEALKPLGGLRNVVVGESRISSIDGERGLLAYRGIDIHELARHSTFEETAYLLDAGVLPDTKSLECYAAELAFERAVPREVLSILGRLKAAHPMASLRTAVSALGALEGDGADGSLDRRCRRLVAQMATLVAAIARLSSDLLPVPPDSTLTHAENFLFMLKGERPSPTAARAMDTALVLHADHEFNASTFAARVAASTLADVHGGVTSALATLKGPLHGGANEAVMKTLEEIETKERVSPWVKEALASKRKIMGFGHAVYRSEDPRTSHLKRLSEELALERGDLRFYALSESLEAEVALQKGLFANVDFYAASFYRTLGIPTPLFTPVFAVARIAGWTAHIKEQLQNNRLIRPESEYKGPRGVPYVPIGRR